MNMEMAVKMAKEGKEEGFNYLYQETNQKSYYVALKYMKQEDAAMDVLQDAYIKAFKCLDQLDDASKFGAWFSRIVATRALDELRKRKIALFSQLEDEEGLGFEETFQDDRMDTQPELSMDQAETSRLVKEMIDALSDEQRMCVMMFYMEELSVKEIAETLQVSENTVKSRLNYGRKNIKEKVLELEKKGTKLYSVAPFTFFLYLLRAEAQSTSVSATAEVVFTKAVSESIKIETGNGVKTPTEATAGAGANVSAGVGKTIGGIAVKKIIVGLAVVVALGGGGAALLSGLDGQSVKGDRDDRPSKNEADIPSLNVDEDDIVKEGTSGEVNWVYTEDKELIIYGEGAMCDYIDLEEGDVENDNLPDNKSSFHKMQIEKIIIKEGVTHIGANSFDCFGVLYQDEVEIMMADSVTSMGEAAFCNMRYVKSIELSKNIKVIPERCFAFNVVSEILIPDGVERIEAGAFEHASNLKAIDIPNSVNYIGKFAFWCCSSAESLHLPDGLTVIEESVFRECSSLTEVVIPNSVVEIKTEAFNGCRELREIEFPESVKVIGSYAFAYCSGLTEVVIPETVQKVDYSIFLASDNIETVYVYSMSKEVGNYKSMGVSQNTNLITIFGIESNPKFYFKEGSGVHEGVLELEAQGFTGNYIILD